MPAMKIQEDQRHLARELALSTLYCLPPTFSLAEEDKENILECRAIAQENLGIEQGEFDENLVQTIINGIISHREDINRIIQECAPQWPLDKIFKVDLVILQIAVFELLFDEKAENRAPEKVVIDEAIELAKQFGNETSSKFINGVLGTVLEKKEEYVLKEDTKHNLQ